MDLIYSNRGPSREIDRVVRLCMVGQIDLALSYLRDQVESRFSKLHGHHALAQICIRISSELESLGKNEYSLQFLNMAISSPSNPRDESFVRHALGVHYYKRGLLQLSASNLKMSLGICDRFPDMWSADDVATTLVSLATVLGEMGKHDEAAVSAKIANRYLLTTKVSEHIRAAAEIVWLRQRAILAYPSLQSKRIALKRTIVCAPFQVAERENPESRSIAHHPHNTRIIFKPLLATHLRDGFLLSLFDVPRVNQVELVAETSDGRRSCSLQIPDLQLQQYNVASRRLNGYQVPVKSLWQFLVERARVYIDEDDNLKIQLPVPGGSVSIRSSTDSLP